MSTITKIQLPDGEVIYARVTGDVPLDADDAHDVAFRGAVPRLAASQLKKLAAGVVGTVREAVDEYEADEVSIEFGVEFSAQTGRVVGVLAQVGGTSSVVVQLTWKGSKADPEQ